MKRLLLLLFVLFLAAPPTLLFAQCPAGTAQTDLSVNNVLARLKNSGDIWWDGNTGTYIIPKEEPDQTSALFAGAVWLGGIDGGGTLRMLSQTYGTGFGSGPLNPITGTTNPTDCNNWDKFFQTTSGSIQLHRDDYSPDGVIDGPIPTSIRGWPARGNQFFADIHGFELPDQDLAFEVSRIVPLATADAGGNRFRVEAELLSPPHRLRPGMHGVAKVTTGEASLLSAWTRELIARVRFWLWTVGY